MTDLSALSIVKDVKFNFAETKFQFAKEKTNGFAVVNDNLGRTG
jgi:hypothetical protein